MTALAFDCFPLAMTALAFLPYFAWMLLVALLNGKIP